MNLSKRIVTGLIIFGFSVAAFGQNPAPANIAAALALKVIKYERNISSSGDVSAYVLNNPDLQSELKKGIGKAIGSATLKAVDGGGDLPATKPSVLFVGDASAVDAALEYSRAQKVLTVTHDPSLVADGVTLGIGVGGDGKPKIVINLTSSNEENLDWNADIMKVARTIK